MRTPVAIVTGAARGVGAATAARLLDDGLAVVAVDLDDPREGDGAAWAGRDGWADRVRVVRGDVADVATGQAAITAAADLGQLQALACCAGVVRDRAFGAQPDEEWAAVHRAALDGTRTMARAALAVMTADAEAELAAGPDARPTDRHIGLTIPAAARTGDPGTSASAAVGGALDALTWTLARELGGWGIRVNAVVLGWIRTRLTGPGDDEVQGLPEPVRQMAAATTALGRLGDPAEAAAVHAFLRGPDASYVTGARVPVTGGLLGG